MNNDTTSDKIANSAMSPIEEVQRLKADIWTEDYIPKSLASMSSKQAKKKLAELPVIVAEGDSWFDYPVGIDVLDQIRRLWGYKIHRFSKAGDTLENMAYGTDINRQFQRRTPEIEEVKAAVRKHKPGFVLFSGGGNDVAGDELISYLNHVEAPSYGRSKAWLRADVWTSALTQMEAAIKHFATAMWSAHPSTKIVMHGYARPVPDGRAVINFPFGFKFVGPWLRPAFARKGHPNWEQTEAYVGKLIDDYNALIAKVGRDLGKKFIYVDTRPVVGRNDWANELHPTNAGFEAVARKIHQDALQQK